MANPQAEEGHVDIANEIVEALARTRISGEEIQCLWVIFRKTYGWKKTEDVISSSQFMEMTGLKKQHVFRALSKLEERGMIAVTKNGATSPNTIKFIKNYDEWKLYSKKVTSPLLVTAIPNNGAKEDPIMVPTKDNKDTSTKDNIARNPEVKLFLDYWHTAYLKKFGRKYFFMGAKDGTLVKKILSSIPLEEAKSLCENYLSCDDEFYEKTGYTIGVFFSQINKLQKPKTKWQDQVKRILEG